MKQPKQLRKEEDQLKSFKDNRTNSKSLPAANNPINFTIQKKENKTGLPDQLKSGIESLSGHSMDDVKVHYNSSQPAQLNAHAYAQGNQIHIAPGQQKHLAHEAWHVVQQKQGRVKPTKQLKSSVAINDSPALEREADVMGAQALQLYATKTGSRDTKTTALNGKTYQLKGRKKKEKSSDEDEQTEEAPETEGAQSNIQEKMVKLCQQLSATGVLSQEVSDWYKNVVINGLCGGWAALHRREPETLEKVWGILEGWDPKDDIKTSKKHSAQTVNLYKQDIVSCLVFAYNEMNKLEPGAGYGETPEDVSSSARQIGKSALSLLKHYSINVGKKDGGQKIITAILNEPKVKKNGNKCIIHLETEKHHMSIRTQSMKSSIKIVSILESEKAGIAYPSSAFEAAKVLDGGIYLNGITDFNVDISIYLQ